MLSERQEKEYERRRTVPPRPWQHKASTVWASEIHILDADGEWLFTIPPHKNARAIAETIVKSVNGRPNKKEKP